MALNAQFYVEHEMRVAYEELLTRKQGSKESVKDFIAALQLLARKAYGSDTIKRDAAIGVVLIVITAYVRRGSTVS